jgi:ATP-dependent helicase HrpB
MTQTTLPVEASLGALSVALASGSHAVLVAAPGAGKTTRVPLALLDEPWLKGRRIMMLEPRRLAARSAARYMAALLGEPVGGTVGYRVRMDTKVGPHTRIEVVTEGVLTRMLQADPGLDGVGLVIFDEFHERSLQADLGLALCLQTRELLRDDLRILVMSATIEAEPVARLLGEAPVIVSAGRQFPVETVYRPPARPDIPVDEAVVTVVREALREQEGDLLVFLPGMTEIRATERKLSARLGAEAAETVRICPLHGSLPPEAQDRAIAPAPPGVRKIVLATNVAETSLTVEGITVVIDSGLTRVSRFSPRTGMSRLETVAVSAASADQRRGRAGRMQPGTCYRCRNP